MMNQISLVIHVQFKFGIKKRSQATYLGNLKLSEFNDAPAKKEAAPKSDLPF